MDADDGTGTLGHLLADCAQLVGMAVVQDGIEHHLILGPVADQLDACLYVFRQTVAQGLGQFAFRPHRRAAHGQNRSQLGQQVGLDFSQAQHVLTRQDGVAVALTGRADQQAADTALRLLGELFAQADQIVQLVARSPGLECLQWLAQLFAQTGVRSVVTVSALERLLNGIGWTGR
ncbi:hypothetical protein D3C79_635390 [compost metagenome]